MVQSAKMLDNTDNLLDGWVQQPDPRLEGETMTLDTVGVLNALARCEEFAELGRNLPGCPALIYRDWSVYPIE